MLQLVTLLKQEASHLHVRPSCEVVLLVGRQSRPLDNEEAVMHFDLLFGTDIRYLRPE
jgi:hypothetical protein